MDPVFGGTNEILGCSWKDEDQFSTRATGCPSDYSESLSNLFLEDEDDLSDCATGRPSDCSHSSIDSFWEDEDRFSNRGGCSIDSSGSASPVVDPRFTGRSFTEYRDNRSESTPSTSSSDDEELSSDDLHEKRRHEFELLDFSDSQQETGKVLWRPELKDPSSDAAEYVTETQRPLDDRTTKPLTFVFKTPRGSICGPQCACYRSQFWSCGLVWSKEGTHPETQEPLDNTGTESKTPWAWTECVCTQTPFSQCGPGCYCVPYPFREQEEERNRRREESRAECADKPKRCYKNRWMIGRRRNDDIGCNIS